MIIVLGRDGEPDPHFGHRGRLSIAVPEGRQFQLAATAFDKQGRLLVAGTTYQPGPSTLISPPPTWAMLHRYLPNGRPDPTFGTKGTVETSFGLASPIGGPAGNDLPSLEVTGMALDSHGRPLITGAVVTKLAETCYTGQRALTSAFVGRISSDGNLNRTFGVNGVVVDQNAAWAQSPVIDRFGRLVYAEITTEQCGHGVSQGVKIVALNESGQFVKDFQSSVPLTTLAPSPIATDHRGRILLLSASGFDCPKSHDLLRLTPHGAPDRHFGARGMARIHLHRCTKISALAVDSRGRPLVAGRWRWDNTGRSKFFLARLTTRGRFDPRFGRGGSVRTAFPKRVGARPLDVLVDGLGRIVVGGLFGDSRETRTSGLALARYLSGS
jgi:uncharacterized delta-60 repeat protein